MSDTADQLAPPDGSGSVATQVVPIQRPPRPGDLSLGWRIATAAAWVGVLLGLAAVWNVSVQLGLSTWWLGPRGEPQPRVVQFLPFIAPVLMLLATINQVRRLPWLGLAAAAVTAAIGLADLSTVTSLALVELAIAVSAAAVSIASFTGVYRERFPGVADADGVTS